MDELDDRQDASPGAGFLGDPLDILRRRWRGMAAIVLGGLLASVALVVLHEPRYSAKATVLIASQRVAQEFVRPTIEEDPLERVNALLGAALSVENLSALIDRYQLYPDLAKEVPREVVVAAMRVDVRVGRENQMGAASGIERAQILGIGYTSDDPETAAAVANDLADLFTEAGIRMRSEQARLTTEFMQRELREAETALREHTRKIGEFQEKHRGELPSELDAQLARLERLQEQRSSLAMQIVEAETRLATIRQDASQTRVAPDSGEARLGALRAALVQELSVNRETHPNVQALRRQIESLEREGVGGGGAGGGGVIAAVQREIAQLREQLADTDEQLVELDARVARIPTLGEEFSALQQRAEVLEQTYTEYLRKVKEAELAESLERAQQGARVSVLDRAFAPTESDGSPAKLAAVTILGSLGLAIGLAGLLEWRDPVLSTEDSVAAAGGVTVLGSVPRIV